MKKVLLAVLVLPFFSYKCDKAAKTVKDGFLKGKVVRISCASFIVQVLNDDALGEDGWKDMTNQDKAYDNVFTANNKCEMPAGVKAGAIIRFKIDEPTKNDCVVCMMYDGPPKLKLDIKDISILEK